ncbi:MAG: class I SAM-dependent methyltransferase [Acidimicrobiia bacterium]|nr:class I SAM-dependent methyltransferase [Acidimicrobiia bacterium]
MPGAGGTIDASAYDEWFETPWGRYAFAAEAALLRRVLGDLGGSRALDAGCGPGRFTEVLRAAGAATVGLDLDPSMAARAAARGTGPVVVGDAARLPFRAGSFDVVVAVTLLEFVADPPRVVGELARVTRAGGRLVLALLNSRSPWGLASRSRRRGGAWAAARLLRPEEVAGWCRGHGEVRRQGALFAPGPLPGLRRLGPLLEKWGRVAPGRGAFQVIVVERR